MLAKFSTELGPSISTSLPLHSKGSLSGLHVQSDNNKPSWKCGALLPSCDKARDNRDIASETHAVEFWKAKI